MTTKQLSEASEYMTHNLSHYRKGIIVVDDKSGEKLQFVKDNIDYAFLKKEGKVSEITIDGTWAQAMRKDNGRECWNRLLAAAYKADHARGLLVINISNIEIFKHCWKLKQLVKQERELIAWQPQTEEDIAPVDREIFSGIDSSRIPDKFMFNGYVLFVINENISWEDILKYAAEYNKGEFDAMMGFCHLVKVEE